MKNNILIDELIKSVNSELLVDINNRWYIAKDIEFFSISTIFGRFKSAYLVLIGRSRAYHYKCDE